MKLVSFVVAPSAIMINFTSNGATKVAPFLFFLKSLTLRDFLMYNILNKI